MKKKILFCATVDYHFKAFHYPYMEWLQAQGWEVHVAAGGEMALKFTDVQCPIPIQRSPFSMQNVHAYRQLKQLIATHKYDIICCHTPLGGALARLAARKWRQHGTKVIYTAHGFHFCKDASFMNWLLYYPIEKYLALHTDHLITINTEDFQLAKGHRFRAREIVHVHGVGVDTIRFQPVDERVKQDWKQSFGYKPDDFLLFNASEFNQNKNQRFLLYALAQLQQELPGLPNIKLLLAGEGPLLEACQRLAVELGIHHMVDFLGFRNDISDMLPGCDVAVASSYREGLPVHLMEAQACGLPVVATDNRGHRELVVQGKNGWLIKRNDVADFVVKLKKLATEPNRRKQMGIYARQRIQTGYSLNRVMQQRLPIYQTYMQQTSEQKEVSLWAAH
ncbi:glycosyltransferase family 4 protein [Ornithinibacillus gellani]|uniref:glycosyltransferase family 4 protein n=1 Tax=Ornithinibacillus gellani TaxID=2293253 RepID=UPI000F4A56BD|nr:glycosyltransferase family 4 protein [Ornithinibacillus gellani]TQS74136.1 glycosyltransferase family 4 protein [Ornithinibacillus gellani]